MKNSRRFWALVLSVLMILSCFSGLIVVSAEEDPNAPVNVETKNMWTGAQIGPHGKYLNGQSFGAKVTVPKGKRLISVAISNLAFYAVGDNKIEIKVFKWKNDYATTVRGTVLGEAVVEGHTNNTTYTFHLPNDVSAEGEILYQVTYLSGPDGMTPWKAEGAASGVTCYANGVPAAPFFFTATFADRLEGAEEEVIDPYAPVNVVSKNMWTGAQIGPHGKYLNGQSFGAKVTVPEGKRLISVAINNLAFYAGGDNKIEIKVFKWKSDYATTVKGKVLGEAVVEGHANNTTYTFHLPNNISAEGEILYQVTYLSGPDGMTPWRAEGAASGVTCYANGALATPFFFTATFADRLEGVEEEVIDPNAPINTENKDLGLGGESGITGGFGVGQGVGVKFTVPAGKRVVSMNLKGCATYTDNVNKIEISAFAWNTDYATTVAGQALATVVVENHQDNQDMIVSFPNNVSLEGEILIQANYVDGAAQFTPKNAADGAAEGVTFYQNGTEGTAFRCTATLADALPDLKCYAEINFGAYVENPATVYNLIGDSGVTFPEKADMGYLTLTATNGDPHFQIHDGKFDAQLAAVTTDKVDFVVIKYRTDVITRGEFYVCRSDGVGYANPMEKSHIGYAYEPDGKWHTVIIDAHHVWGNVEGVNLQNFRFDFGNGEGTVDVAYIRFYATREGAEACAVAEEGTWTETVTVAIDDPAVHQGDDGNYYYGESNIPLTHVPATGEQAECYTYEVEQSGIKPPKIPFNVSELDLKYIYEGSALTPSNVGNTVAPTYDYENGYVTYVATGDDPQIYLDATGLEVGPYMVIKYRGTNVTTSDAMECFIGAADGPQGTTDNKQWPVIADGEWHTTVVYIGDLADYNSETNVINHFRFDFLRGAAGTSADESIDVQYIAFFGDKASAEYYAEFDPYVLPEKPKYTVTFVVEGIDIAIIEYTMGDTAITGVPEVPAKEGYIGEWESYTLNNTNIIVNAVYTEKPAEPDVPADTEPTDTEPTDTEPVDTPTEAPTDAPEDPTESPSETDATETDAPAKKGCKSVVGMGMVAVMAAAAAVVALKKKED